MNKQPLVSVVLTTRDRPEFLRAALRLYREQRYRLRELIVVDDGEVYPVDTASVAAVGGQTIRAVPGTSIGMKLNLGLDAARGELCMKMDDDDWYSPRYISSFVDAFQQSWRQACRPTVGFVTPFLFFHIAAWEVRQSAEGNVPGATLFFRHCDWREAPFRNLFADEDFWFYQDQLRIGSTPLAINDSDLFLAVRHRGSNRNRGHTWVNQWNNISLESFLEERPLYKRPEVLLPPWALSFYRNLRSEILTSMEESAVSDAS